MRCASMGDRQTKPISDWFSRSVFKRAALWFPSKWPHGVQTVPECDPRREGTTPAVMENDLRELRELLEQFARQPREFELQAQPIFGTMTEKEWMRWGYLHMDHHLRQFGA